MAYVDSDSRDDRLAFPMPQNSRAFLPFDQDVVRPAEVDSRGS